MAWRVSARASGVQCSSDRCWPGQQLHRTSAAPHLQQSAWSPANPTHWYQSHNIITEWRHGSAVKTSVFGWQTFLDLRLIYGWHVTTLWVKCPPWVNQPGKFSLPSLWGRQIRVITLITRVEAIKWQTRAMCGCFVELHKCWTFFHAIYADIVWLASWNLTTLAGYK